MIGEIPRPVGDRVAEHWSEISPHGKVPVLSVGGKPRESNAIAEYLDEMVPPRCTPTRCLDRLRISAASAACTPRTRSPWRRGWKPRARLAKLEEALAKERDNDGPYFNGPDLCLVDAAYAPFFMRYAVET